MLNAVCTLPALRLKTALSSVPTPSAIQTHFPASAASASSIVRVLYLSEIVGTVVYCLLIYSIYLFSLNLSLSLPPSLCLCLSFSPLSIWGGGEVQPHFSLEKNVSFPMYLESKWKERETNTFPSLSIYFFPIFPWEKWEKTHFSHGKNWGWTPHPLYSSLSLSLSLYPYLSLSFFLSLFQYGRYICLIRTLVYYLVSGCLRSDSFSVALPVDDSDDASQLINLKCYGNCSKYSSVTGNCSQYLVFKTLKYT